MRIARGPPHQPPASARSSSVCCSAEDAQRVVAGNPLRYEDERHRLRWAPNAFSLLKRTSIFLSNSSPRPPSPLPPSIYPLFLPSSSSSCSSSSSSSPPCLFHLFHPLVILLSASAIFFSTDLCFIPPCRLSSIPPVHEFHIFHFILPMAVFVWGIPCSRPPINPFLL